MEDELYETYDTEECETIEPEECPACTGTGFYFGTLGILVYYRCRDCGCQFVRA